MRPGSKRLVAYVVAAAGMRASMRRRCARIWREQLPDYMVPSAFVVLERLPLTPNGKLDRRALPAPELTAARRCAAPRTPQEEILCALFAEVLGVARVGIDDNFFALGGDSIMSIQLVSRARKAGLVITPRAVFQHQTVEALAGRWRKPCRAGGCGACRLRATLPLVSLSQAEIERLERRVPADRGHAAAVAAAGGAAVPCAV